MSHEPSALNASDLKHCPEELLPAALLSVTRLPPLKSRLPSIVPCTLTCLLPAALQTLQPSNCIKFPLYAPLIQPTFCWHTGCRAS